MDAHQHSTISSGASNVFSMDIQVIREAKDFTSNLVVPYPPKSAQGSTDQKIRFTKTDTKLLFVIRVANTGHMPYLIQSYGIIMHQLSI